MENQSAREKVGAIGKRIALIPAGERWSDGSLRPAVEDWIAAGAIINELNGSLSPESRGARAAFRDAAPDIVNGIAQCSSGQELTAKNFARDIELAAAWNASDCVPSLCDGAYVSS